MKTRARNSRGFTLVEIMTVVVIVGILSALAIPALMHVKSKSQDTIALHTIRQLYDAKEHYFSEDGAGKGTANVTKLVQTGYASHSLDVATQHDIGPWHTAGLRSSILKPGNPVTVLEVFTSGRTVNFGRKLTYPDQP